MFESFRKRREERRSAEFLARYKQLEDSWKTVRVSLSNQFIRDPVIMDGYAKQSNILYGNGRKVIAIFITKDLFDILLEKSILDKESRIAVRDALIYSGKPIGHLSEIPIYISSIMTKSNLFVVGEITWELKKWHQN